MKKFFKDNKLIILIICIDLLFIALHYISNRNMMFNLDGEYNIPTLYQTFKLYTIFLLSITVIYFSKIFQKPKDSILKLFWIGISTFFLYLSIDEMIQIHERIAIIGDSFIGSSNIENYESLYYMQGFNSADWLPFYIPIFIGVMFLSLLFFRKILNIYGKKSYLLLITMFFFLMTFLMEYIGTSPSLNGGMVELWITIEESCEMIGATVVLWFVYKCLNKKEIKKYV